MTDETLEMALATLDHIAAVASEPTRNDLMVCFIIGPVSDAEKNRRRTQAFEEIAAMASAAAAKIRQSSPLKAGDRTV